MGNVRLKNVVTSSISYRDYDLEGDDIVITETYGHTVLLDRFEGVRCVDEGTSIAFLDGAESRFVDVRDESKHFDGLIPVNYVVRTLNGTYWEFECGFDLCPDGKVWVGLERTFFNSIREAFDYLENRLGWSFRLSLEESMLIDKDVKYE